MAKRDSILYALRDAASDTYSASRIASLFMVLVDTAWMVTAVIGLPPKEAFVPVSSMLSACTVAAFSAYGLNSAASAWKQTGEAIASTVFRKTTTVTKDDGVPGDAEKLTTTVTSHVETVPGDKAKGPKPQGGC